MLKNTHIQWYFLPYIDYENHVKSLKQFFTMLEKERKKDKRQKNKERIPKLTSK